MRLNRYIAQTGKASRRGADELIQQGRVLVNGKRVTELGVVIDPIKDKVKIDGYTIQAPLTKTYIAFYKPRGILSSMATGPDTLQEFVNRMGAAGLNHVGRLDRESEGLLLLTNDGDWAHRIAHPKFQIVKQYEIELDRRLSEEGRTRLITGITLSDGLFRADSIEFLEGRSIRISIHDGRNRVLRRAFEALGFDVLKLKRTQIGRINLGRMRPGDWKEINASSF